MAAGLGFKDFTTGEVLTAADVDGYLMQGVWVFASATARDAAVTSPQEGNFAYLKDTNTTTYYTGSAWTNLDTTGMVNPMTTTGDTIYSSSGSTPARLGIGSTGQVLTVAAGVPSWATPSSAGGMTLISTTTLTGNASVTLSSIPQTYKDLRLIIRDFFPTNGSLALRLNADTNNVYCYASINSVSSNTVSNNAGTSNIVLNNGAVDAKNADRDAHAVFNFIDYTQSLDQIYDGTFMINGNTSDNPMVIGLTGGYFPTTPAAITSILIYSNGAGNINGTALLYGVN